MQRELAHQPGKRELSQQQVGSPLKFPDFHDCARAWPVPVLALAWHWSSRRRRAAAPPRWSCGGARRATSVSKCVFCPRHLCALAPPRQCARGSPPPAYAPAPKVVVVPIRRIGPRPSKCRSQRRRSDQACRLQVIPRDPSVPSSPVARRCALRVRAALSVDLSSGAVHWGAGCARGLRGRRQHVSPSTPPR